MAGIKGLGNLAEKDVASSKGWKMRPVNLNMK